MKNDKRNTSIIFFAGIVIIAAFSRMIPHPFNMTPVGAMAIFAGAYLSKDMWKYIIPIGAYWLSDLLVMNTLYASYYEGFQWFGSPGVYISLLLIIGFSALMFSNKKKSKYLQWAVPTAVGSSVIFFLVSNFGSWISSPMYTKDFVGLIDSYVAGIPFYKWTLLSYVFYSVVLFGLVHLMERRFDFLKPTA